MYHLKNPLESWSEIFRKLHTFMLKSLSTKEVFSNIEELYMSKRFARYFSHLPRDIHVENHEIWKKFTNDILENLRIFKEFCKAFGANSYGKCSRYQQVWAEIKENNEKLQEILRIFEENNDFSKENEEFSKIISEPNNKLHLKTLEDLHKKCYEVDKNPEQRILSTDLSDLVFEIRFGYWMIILLKMLINNISLQDLMSSKFFLEYFLLRFRPEKLEVSSVNKIYKTFQALTKTVLSWTSKYESFLKSLFQNNFNDSSRNIEEVYMKAKTINQSLPLSCPEISDELSNLEDVLLGSVKAKQILFKMDVEKKVAGVKAIQILHDFFENVGVELPYSKEISNKIDFFKDCRDKVIFINRFFKSKRHFDYLIVSKDYDPETLTPGSASSVSPSPVFLMRTAIFRPNASNFYDYYEENSLKYSELTHILEFFKQVLTKEDRSYLGLIKRNCEEFMNNLFHFLDHDFQSTIELSKKGNYYYNLKNQFKCFLSFRNALIQNQIIYCEGIKKLRVCEWIFYAQWTINSNFWMLVSQEEVEMMKHDLILLRKFCYPDKEIILVPLNNIREIQGLITEGEYYRGSNTQVDILLEQILLSKKVFQIWYDEIFFTFRDSCERWKKSRHKGMVFQLKFLIEKLFNGRIYEENSFEFLIYCVEEYKNVRNWFEYAFNKSGKSKKRYAITEKIFKSICLFHEPIESKLLSSIVLFYSRIKNNLRLFMKKKSVTAFKKIKYLYRESRIRIVEVEDLFNNLKQTNKLLNSLYYEFQQMIRTNYSPIDLFSIVCTYKERLCNEIPIYFRFLKKYQSFWIELLENQVNCFKICFFKIINPIDMKQQFFEKPASTSTKKLITLQELREIDQEKQGLSKPAREFLEEFLKKCRDPKEIFKKSPQILEFLNLEPSVEKKKNYVKTSLFHFQRKKQIFLIRNSIEKICKKKASNLASFIERRIYLGCNRKRDGYFKGIEEVLIKLNSFNEEKDIFDGLEIHKKPKNEEILRVFNEEIQTYLNLREEKSFNFFK